jgi:hypothetical protein
MDIENKIIMCKTCGSTENKIRINRRVCHKCQNNRYRKKEYFDNYYKEHKEQILERSMNSYYTKTKLLV